MLLSMNWVTEYSDGCSMRMTIFDIGYIPGNIRCRSYKARRIGRLEFRKDYRPVKDVRYHNSSEVGKLLHLRNIFKILTNDTKQEIKIVITSVSVKGISKCQEHQG